MKRISFFVVLGSMLAMTSIAWATRPYAAKAKSVLERITKETGVRPDVVSWRMDGLPRSILGRLSLPSKARPVDIALDFISFNRPLFVVPVDQLQLKNTTPAAGTKVLRFDQTYKGLPVLGAALALVVNEKGMVYQVSNSLKEDEGQKKMQI
ncbi:MAG: hypothetical protein GY847_35365 [Proteobacteria bacterium]|nr:hypothetical protein [Pseudomonadota bacterium]